MKTVRASERRGTARRTSAERDTDDLARGAGVNYLGFIARIAPRALFLVLAGRFYGESHFGYYTFGITVVETVAAMALFGMKRSLFKFMSEAAARGETVYRAIAHGVALAVAVAIVLAVAMAAAAVPVAGFFGLPEAAAPLQVFTLAIPMIVLSDILLVAIRFTRQMRFDVYARSLAEPIALTLALVVVYWAGIRELGLAIAYVASLAVAAAATAFFFVRVFPLGACLRVRLRWREMRRLASFSGPTAAYDLLIMLSDKVDVLLVSFFMPAPVVGVYGMARQFATATKKVRSGFDRILPPILSESLAVGDRARADGQLTTVSRWILTVQMIVVLFFVFFGTTLLGFLDGAFASGALILILLMIGDAVTGSLGVSELPFVYLRPGANVAFGALWLSLGIATNVWLIQVMGAEGAALGVLVTVTVVNATRVAANRWMFDLKVVSGKLFKPVAAAVPAAGALLAIEALLPDAPGLALGLGVPALLASYAAALALLGLEPEDRSQLRRILARWS